jgi:hypothetical protein
MKISEVKEHLTTKQNLPVIKHQAENNKILPRKNVVVTHPLKLYQHEN